MTRTTPLAEGKTCSPLSVYDGDIADTIGAINKTPNRNLSSTIINIMTMITQAR